MNERRRKEKIKGEDKERKSRKVRETLLQRGGEGEGARQGKMKEGRKERTEKGREEGKKDGKKRWS